MRIASHRGIGTGERENSLVAFEQALASGASLLEIDLRRTLDGRLMLAHDTDLGMWGRPDAWLPNITYDELLQITGGEDRAIATFADFSSKFPNQDIILDIKWRGGIETLISLHSFVREHLDMDDFLRRASLLVWRPEHFASACQLFPGIRMVYNRVDCAKTIFVALAGQQHWRADMPCIVSIPAQIFRWHRLARRIVDQLRSPRSTLMVYLPRHTREIEVAQTLGVELVMTDDFYLTRSLVCPTSQSVGP